MRVLRHAAADEGVWSEVHGCGLAFLTCHDVGDGGGGDDAQGGGEEEGEAGHCLFLFLGLGEARELGLAWACEERRTEWRDWRVFLGIKRAMEKGR